MRNPCCPLWPSWVLGSGHPGVPTQLPGREGMSSWGTGQQPRLIQAAVCNPLAGLIKDFLQKYHFPAAGWLDFANCLWPLAAQEASAGRTWPAWGADTPRSSLGQNRKVCTNKVCMIQDEKGARENNPPMSINPLDISALWVLAWRPRATIATATGTYWSYCITSHFLLK